jgi:Domain of unknown function (DUF6285)
MQTRPDHPTLLEAIGAFLLTELSPKLEADKALQFRVLIAANLASVVANELRTNDERLTSELGRLKALLAREDLPNELPSLELLNRRLATELRAGAHDQGDQAALLDHLFQTAKETLVVTNPRFEVGD